jgi:hypothetical protein
MAQVHFLLPQEWQRFQHVTPRMTNSQTRWTVEL